MLECIAALQKKVNQGNSVCSQLQALFLSFLFLVYGQMQSSSSFNVPLFDMKIPSTTKSKQTDSFSSEDLDGVAPKRKFTSSTLLF